MPLKTRRVGGRYVCSAVKTAAIPNPTNNAAALATPTRNPIFGLYFEAIGQATAGIEPFAGLAGQLLDGWISWLTGFFTGSESRRRAQAEATLALLDGLLLMRQLAGGAAADRAATTLGLR